MSFLLDAPAGKHGPVKADGDNLVFADGTPARFWGVRLQDGWDGWSPEKMEETAARLALYGCNLVGINLPDDPTALTRLSDRLKPKGIYIVLNEKKLSPQSSPAPSATQVLPLEKDPAVVPSELVKKGLAPESSSTLLEEKGVSFKNEPTVTNPERSSLVGLISQRVFGKPFLAQWDAYWPNEYIAELPLLISAFSTFEGWAGSLGCSFQSFQGDGWLTNIAPGDGLWDKPVLLAQWPVAAMAYLRGDLKEGRLHILNGDNHSLESLAHRSGQVEEDATLKTDLAGKLKAKINEKNHSFISDSGQINWQGNVGVVQVSSPRFQSIIGFIGHRKLVSPVWQVESTTAFASLSLISVTKTNLWASDHMLLTGVARMENTGQVYNASKTKLVSLGKAPILLEPLQGKITLFRYKSDTKLRVRALDANGQVLQKKVPMKWAKNNLVISWIPSAIYLEIFKNNPK